MDIRQTTVFECPYNAVRPTLAVGAGALDLTAPYVALGSSTRRSPIFTVK